MDFGEAKFILSRHFNAQLLIVESERFEGCVYKFYKKTDNTFVCSTCQKLGRTRVVTVRDGRITGHKHPEEDHHPDCRPVSRASVDVLDIDRSMRSEVRRTGKRPRDAYSEAVAEIPKRFKSSQDQEEVIARFPTFSEIRVRKPTQCFVFLSHAFKNENCVF